MIDRVRYSLYMSAYVVVKECVVALESLAESWVVDLSMSKRWWIGGLSDVQLS